MHTPMERLFVGPLPLPPSMSAFRDWYGTRLAEVDWSALATALSSTIFPVAVTLLVLWTGTPLWFLWRVLSSRHRATGERDESGHTDARP